MLKRIVLEHITNLDYSIIEKLLSDFIKEYLLKSGGRGYIVGVSGGLDSAAAVALAARSVGANKVFALILPDKNVTPTEDIEDAITLVKELKVDYHIIEISEVVNVFKKIIPIHKDDEEDKLSLGNLRARVRMCILYYYANKLKYLVLGTSDRSEYLIGYFTKYGDGAADVAPLTVLYKTQVRLFAKYLGVPKNIVEKPSAPRLWPKHIAEEELGIKYEDIDLVLAAHLDLGIAEEDIPNVIGVDRSTVNKVLTMYRFSIHKRQGGPVIPDLTILNTIRSMILNNIQSMRRFDI